MTVIDFHNHYYPPAYLDALRSGDTTVRVTEDNDGNPLLHYPGDYNVAVRGHRDIAFRAEDVDWQIWIAQGGRPYPCRYVITSKKVDNAPQYSVQIRDWKAGDQVASDDFSFKNATSAKKLDLAELADADDLPKIFERGASK